MTLEGSALPTGYSRDIGSANREIPQLAHLVGR